MTLKNFKVRERKSESRVSVHFSADTSLPRPDQKEFKIPDKIRFR